jgi:hypothetical protein
MRSTLSSTWPTPQPDAVTEQTPDGVPCRHCSKPIYWDEVCWVHDNGFADCGLVVYGGTKISSLITTDPQFAQEHSLKGKMAEPVGKWS